MVDLAIRGATLITMNENRDVLDPGLMLVNDGRITLVEEDAGDAVEADETRDLTGRIVLPGFVNTHCHLVSVLVRGMGLDRFQTEIDPRGKQMAGRIRDALDRQLAYLGTRLALTELMASGVTTIADSQTARRGLEGGSDGTLDALTESGLRSIWYRASVDTTDIIPADRQDTPSLAQSELERLRAQWNSELVTVGAEALSLQRVTRPMLEALAEWSTARDAPFAMHVAYSESAARYPVETYGAPLLNVLDDFQLLNNRFLGHHPVHLEPEEFDVVADSGAGFSWSPAANMLIGLAAAPVEELVSAKVRLGLGTDQPNDGHSMFESMKAGILQKRAAAGSTEFGSPEEMLDLATIGGARALHLDDKIGSLETGKRADFLIIDEGSPMLSPRPGLISNLVYAATAQVVQTVIVEGKTIFEQGSPAAWDGASVVSELNQMIARLLVDER